MNTNSSGSLKSRLTKYVTACFGASTLPTPPEPQTCEEPPHDAMGKEHILQEIRRTAEANNGVPLGRRRFFNDTGIRQADCVAQPLRRETQKRRMVRPRPRRRLRLQTPQIHVRDNFCGVRRPDRRFRAAAGTPPLHVTVLPSGSGDFTSPFRSAGLWPAILPLYWPVIAVFRLAISEVINAPEVARALDSIARERSRGSLRKIMTAAQASGLLTGRPAELARQFAGLLWRDLQVSLLLGVAERPNPREIGRRARDATAAFLQLHPPPNDSPVA